MAGITAILTNDPQHPAHAAAAEAIAAHSLGIAACRSLSMRAGDGRLTVLLTVPAHIRASVDDASGIARFGSPESARAEERADAWESGLYDGVTVAFDRAADSVTIRTDRFNRHPVFFAKDDGVVFATTEPSALLRGGVLPFEWDMPSVASVLRWGFPLFPGTIYRGLEQSAGASLYALDPANGQRLLRTATETLPGSVRLDDVIDLYAQALERVFAEHSNAAVALSGGWDTRATLAVLLGLGRTPTLMTFGVEGSTDLSIARVLARRSGLPHRVLLFGDEFVHAMHEYLARLARAGNGLATPMAAHEVHINTVLAREFDTLVDSAGCEFRRGYRMRRSMDGAPDAHAVARVFLASHERGLWNRGVLSDSMLREGGESERTLLSRFDPSASKDDTVDALFGTYVWNGHYAHSYNSQAHAMHCSMPMYDPAVHAAFLALPKEQRWGKDFQIRAMKRFRPELLRVAISHNGMRVPPTDALWTKVPALARHALATKLSRTFGIEAAWLDSKHSHLRYGEWTAWMRDHTPLLAPAFLSRHAEWFADDHDAIVADPDALLAVEYMALIESEASDD
ncbi:MAG: hypothetical protein IPP94_14670 [Ignavibacteria bacterium]|nr:hypothetical protein [Ignavibacteria bacterium]